jgi:hypothetical protein
MADYIDNKMFTDAVVKHREACFLAEAEGRERPQIPRYVAECIMLIARRLANRPNFYNYTYKEEMISEAMVTCCAKICHFNPNVTQNAFAYFSQVCWYDFISYIDYEKKEAYVKAKSFYNAIEENGSLYEEMEDDEHDITSEFIPYFDVAEFEKKDKEKRDKLKKKQEIGPLDDLMKDDETDEE